MLILLKHEFNESTRRVGAGTLGVPLGGTRRVGGLLGVAGRLSVRDRLALQGGTGDFP